jgi:hypothetical protein
MEPFEQKQADDMRIAKPPKQENQHTETESIWDVLIPCIVYNFFAPTRNIKEPLF